MWIALLLSLIALAAVLLLRYRRSRPHAGCPAITRGQEPARQAAAPVRPGPAGGGAAQINGLLEDRETETRQLREREESLRRQIANVSHDLRTPLTSILGYLQLLQGDTLDQEQRERYLQVVEGRARVLQELITAFYDLSRIEGGEYPLEIQPVDLRRRLEPLLASFYDDFQQAGFQVEVSLEDNLPPVLADPGAVTRVLTNLLSNALKHGSQSLSIRLEREGDCLVTAFSNDAPHLTQEDLPRVFERFYTGDQMPPARIPVWDWPSSRLWLSAWATPPSPSWKMGYSPWGCAGICTVKANHPPRPAALPGPLGCPPAESSARRCGRRWW